MVDEASRPIAYYELARILQGTLMYIYEDAKRLKWLLPRKGLSSYSFSLWEGWESVDPRTILGYDIKCKFYAADDFSAPPLHPTYPNRKASYGIDSMFRLRLLPWPPWGLKFSFLIPPNP